MNRIITCLYCILFISAGCTSQNSNCYKSTEQCRDLNTSGFNQKFRDISIAPDHSLLGCGDERINDSTWQVFVARYTDKGIPDSAFGVYGIARPLSGFKSEAYAMEVTETNIFVAGCIYPDPLDYHAEYAVWCFTKTGLPDTSFNGTGWNTFRMKEDVSFWEITIQPDGKAVCSGSIHQDGSERITVVRFNKNGSIDQSFGKNGMALSPPEIHFSEIGGMTTDDKGRILVTGSKKAGEENVSYVWRMLADGKTDNTFGNAGIADITVSKFGDEPRAIQILTDGDIAVAGYYYHKDDSISCFMFRLDEKGLLLKKFCNAGIYKDTALLDEDNVYGHFFEIRKDGVMIMSGYVSNSQGYTVCETTFLPGE